MDYHLLKLKETDLFVSGYVNYKVDYTSHLQRAMYFQSTIFMNEFIDKYLKGVDVDIYKIILEKI